MLPNEQAVSAKALIAARNVHANVTRRRHQADLLWEANNLLLWILYVTTPHLREYEGRVLIRDGICSLVHTLDADGKLSEGWRQSFLAFAVCASVGELPRQVANWVKCSFATSNLSEGITNAIITYVTIFIRMCLTCCGRMGIRYALLVHVQSDVRLDPMPDDHYGFAMFTRIARRKGDILVFLTGHISSDAAGGAAAREYDNDRPRAGQPLRWLLGPIRFVWAGCAPNCEASSAPTFACSSLTPIMWSFLCRSFLTAGINLAVPNCVCCAILRREDNSSLLSWTCTLESECTARYVFTR